MACWWLLLAISAQLVDVAVGGAVLKLKFLSFTNSEDKDFKGKACDPHNDCDHEFIFCVDKYAGSNNEDFSQCRLSKGPRKSGYYKNKKVNYFGTDINGVHNPINDTITKWEGKARLKVRVMDADSGLLGKDDLVDKLYKNLEMRPFRSESESVYIRPHNDVVRGTRTKAPTSLLMDWTVYCEKDYYGADCATFCQAMHFGTAGYTCDPDTGERVCKEGWESPADDCMIFSDDCLGHKCEHGATCVDGDRDYTCDCAKGYTGDLCEINVDDCLLDVEPCRNGGTCHDDVGNYTCTCPPDRVGRQCDLHVCHQSVDPCLNGGTCYDDGQCLCLPGFTGDDCGQDVCSNKFCNGGTCSSGRCHCPPGFASNDCSLDLCSLLDCENGGSCNSGVCTCPMGYEGKFCHYKIKTCKTCLNDGMCDFQQDVCRCMPGFTGVRCETEIKSRLNDTIPDVTVAEQVGNKSDGPGMANWTMGLLIALLVLVLIIILVVVLLLKYRRRLSRAKQEAAAGQGSPGVGNFNNPLYVPQYINNIQQERQNSVNEDRSLDGAVGGEPVYENPGPGLGKMKYLPSPLNLSPHGNHYDVPEKSKGGAFASVVDDEEAPPLPTKQAL